MCISLKRSLIEYQVSTVAVLSYVVVAMKTLQKGTPSAITFMQRNHLHIFPEAKYKSQTPRSKGASEEDYNMKQVNSMKQ